MQCSVNPESQATFPGISGGDGHMLSKGVVRRKKRAGSSCWLGGRCFELDPGMVSLTPQLLPLPGFRMAVRVGGGRHWFATSGKRSDSQSFRFFL